jgi:hypothetical protein
MTRIQGQILRTVGLLIEMLGILVLVYRTKTDAAGSPLPGSLSLTQAWAVIGAGFALWFVGSIVIYWPRAERRHLPVDTDQNDQERLKL